MPPAKKKNYKREVYCNCTLTYCKRLVALDTRYRHRRKMRKLLEDKELIAAAPNSEEKRNIGTSFGKRESTALQDQTVEQACHTFSMFGLSYAHRGKLQVPVQGLQDEAQRDSGKTGQRTTEVITWCPYSVLNLR